MTTIFLITKKVKGPHGHGEPGEPYLALATDGDSYTIGEPLPAFTTFKEAEEARENFDKYNSYTVTELDVK